MAERVRFEQGEGASLLAHTQGLHLRLYRSGIVLYSSCCATDLQVPGKDYAPTATLICSGCRAQTGWPASMAAYCDRAAMSVEVLLQWRMGNGAVGDPLLAVVEASEVFEELATGFEKIYQRRLG